MSSTMNGSSSMNGFNGVSFSKLLQLKMSTAAMMASVSEEEQHFYNHHIIENFIESVREMNDAVLIPSKLKDLEPVAASAAAATTTTTAASNNNNLWNGSNILANTTMNSNFALNDDLYSYYQMINVVKNDLFEPYSESDSKKIFGQVPKRKISRQQRQQQRDANNANITRNISTSSLSSLLNGNMNANSNNNTNGNLSGNQSNSSGTTTPNGQHSPPVVLDHTDYATELEPQQQSQENGNILPNYHQFLPLSQEQLIQQQLNARQLTLQFNHHLHSLYAILDHFTQAADFITQSYIKECEQCNNI